MGLVHVTNESRCNSLYIPVQSYYLGPYVLGVMLGSYYPGPHVLGVMLGSYYLGPYVLGVMLGSGTYRY